MGRNVPVVGEPAAHVLLALLVALATTTALISLFFADKALVLSMLGSIPLLMLFLASTNQRLFCIWGLVLTAPLSLGKSYMPIAHMGGAGAYTIDASDAFLLPLLLFILRDRIDGFRPRLRLSPYVFFWGGLLFLGGMDVVVGGGLRHVAAQEDLRVAKCLLLFFVILNETVRLRQMLHIAAALLVGVGFEAIIGFLQFVTNHSLGLQALGEATSRVVEYSTSKTDFGGDTFFRVSALLEHPNLFGAYLALLLPIGIALLFSRISPTQKLFISIAVGMGVLALVTTLSRSSWLSFGIAFVAVMSLSFVHERLRHRYLTARLAAVMFLVLALVLLSGVIGRRLLDSDPGAVNFRWEWMGVAWNMVLERPLLGFGLNSFIFHLPGRTKFGPMEMLNQEFGTDWPIVHNTYLIYWSEQGTIGFIFFMGMNFYLLWIGLRNLKRIKDDTLFTINLGCLSGIMAIMNDGFASFFLRVAPGGRLFAIVAGLLVAVDYCNRASAPATARAVVTTTEPDHQPLAAPLPNTAD